MEFLNSENDDNDRPRSTLKLWLAIACLCAICLWQTWQLHLNAYAQTQIIYSRDQAADQAIIAQIQNAHQYIYFAMYTLTRADLADALIAAKLRGVDVIGVLDGGQTTIPQEAPIIKKLRSFGIVLEIAQLQDGLMHMKLLVTDNTYASGSFNWTTAATSYNDEVLEIGHVQSIRLQYLKVFKELSKRYQ